MKKIILFSLLISFLSYFTSKADDKTVDDSADSVQTLLGKGDLKFGIFGGPEFKFTYLNGDFAFMSGGKGGILINHDFSIGGGGYSLSTHHRITFPDGTKSDYISFNYGGLVLEATMLPKEAVHSTISILIGGGSVSYTHTNIYSNLDFGGSNVFVLEPEVNIEANLIEYIKVGFGGSYRFVTGSDIPYLSNSNLMGFSGNLYIKFGIDDIFKFFRTVKDKFHNF